MRHAAQDSIAGKGVWLAVMALLVRALIPGGYMLAPATADAWPQIVICGEANPATAHSGDHAPETPDRNGDQHCAFAVHAGNAPPPDAVAPRPTLGLPQVDPLALRHEAPHLEALASPPPPATGPPALD